MIKTFNVPESRGILLQTGDAGSAKNTVRASVRGRVRNFVVGKENSLLALFEAVTNSFQAIAEARSRNQPAGRIEIEVIRRAPLGGIGSPIFDGFQIVDDGVGFDESNYDSFCTADSTRKEDKGGKGVGRFSWLKVFTKAEIDSVFLNGNGYLRRSFVFDKEDRDEGALALPCEANTARTTVRMFGLQGPYLAGIPKTADEIAQAIVEHCVPMLSREDSPTLTLKDGEEVFNLADYFKKFRLNNADVKETQIFGNPLKITVFRAERGQHRISFAAHGRLVAERHLSSALQTSYLGFHL